jgi:hypothetical protein
MNPDQQLNIDRKWILSEFGDKGPAILREMQYYNLYGELPFDAAHIEKIEWVNGNAIIVHRDPDARND